ncbi:VOC family protein [Nonomuraea africana]|uniref:Glyoxalase superfamily protein PhnB n=1 Tax=Nonomuraea africana TaxID=46171 RepID=A0ABR9KHJ8_9ACTN|nr:VOC family protein [Nonomuraea africana]MBE1561464.1 putative glyoxalase superfamily protein PhnB [Nonomuraea africana]
MLRGLATTTFWADDVPTAARWYTEFLGIEPYFERRDPDGGLAYAEFRVGDYQHELGIADRAYAPPGAADSPGGAIVRWHVDDLKATVEKLLSMGAEEYQPLTDRGEGFVTAAVVDPFGNVLGLTYNPHYLAVLGTFRKV